MIQTYVSYFIQPQDCPNGYDRNREMLSYEDCDRCGSGAHKTNVRFIYLFIYSYLNSIRNARLGGGCTNMFLMMND